MRVLVTGGAGYVGSHACVSLLDAGHEVIVIDDFSNSEEGVLRTVRELTGIYVMDLAEGHIAALEFLMRRSTVTSDGVWNFNLGTGKGCSVLELAALADKGGWALHSSPPCSAAKVTSHSLCESRTSCVATGLAQEIAVGFRVV